MLFAVVINFDAVSRTSSSNKSSMAVRRSTAEGEKLKEAVKTVEDHFSKLSKKQKAFLKKKVCKKAKKAAKKDKKKKKKAKKAAKKDKPKSKKDKKKKKKAKKHAKKKAKKDKKKKKKAKKGKKPKKGDKLKKAVHKVHGHFKQVHKEGKAALRKKFSC